MRHAGLRRNAAAIVACVVTHGAFRGGGCAKRFRYVTDDPAADAAHRTELSLSSGRMRFIYSSVPKDHKVDVRVRLALGAEVPRNVQLLTFPGDVVAQIPEVERFRYVVVDNDVVIVDPTERGVVLVINE